MSKTTQKKEYSRKETVTVSYENVLFTDLSTKTITSKEMREYSNLLDLISLDNNLKCRFFYNCFVGKSNDIRKAQNILINSVKYN
jgi:hypothetical protein